MNTPLLGFIRDLEGKSSPARRQALIHLLESKGYPYTVHEYSLWGRVGKNLVVTLGQGEKEILASAHYDAKPGTPGANDNASGVAALLGLLGKLTNYSPKNKINAVFFDGEESQLGFACFRIGCAGSCAYAKQATAASVLGMYNLEMCGFGDAVAMWPVDHRDNPALSALRQTLHRRGIPYATANINSLLFSSDHLHFRRAGIEGAFTVTVVPRQRAESIRAFVESRVSIVKLALSRMTGKPMGVPEMFRRMHSPEDKSEYLSETSLEMVSDVVSQAIMRLDQGS